MDVKVLGPGCTRCKKLYEQVDQAIKQLGLHASLEKVDNIEEIIKYRVLSTPALVINGEVKVAGRVPDAAELNNLLTTAAMSG